MMNTEMKLRNLLAYAGSIKMILNAVKYAYPEESRVEIIRYGYIEGEATELRVLQWNGYIVESDEYFAIDGYRRMRNKIIEAVIVSNGNTELFCSAIADILEEINAYIRKCTWELLREKNKGAA